MVRVPRNRDCPPVTADVVDLAARRHARECALALAARAPVLHITPEFLAALNCREDDEPMPPVRHLHAV